MTSKYHSIGAVSLLPRKGQNPQLAAADSRSEAIPEPQGGEEGPDSVFLSDTMHLALSTVPLLDVRQLFLGRFELKQLTWRGRYAAVYHALDTVTGLDVALKVSHANTADDQGTNPLEWEAYVSAHLADSRSVPKLSDLFSVHVNGEALTVLSMEWISADSLRHHLAADDFKADGQRIDVVSLFRQICEAVLDVHRHGVIHLDIKPENLLVVDDHIRICDFASAVFVTGSQHDNSDCCPSTDSWKGGTAEYRAPELRTVQSSREIRPAADIYSLGVVLDELMIAPVHCTTDKESRMPAALHTVRARCLERDPAERYSSVDELIRALKPRPSRSMNGSQDIERDLDEIVARARALARRGQFKEANNLCRKVMDVNPHHTEASRIHVEIEERFEHASRLYERITAGIDTRDLAESLMLLREASDTFPNHPAGQVIQDQLEARFSQFARHMSVACRAKHRGNVPALLCQLSQAYRVNPGSRILQPMIDALTWYRDRQQYLLSEIDRAVVQHDLPAAQLLASRADGLSEQMGIISRSSGGVR